MCVSGGFSQSQSHLNISERYLNNVYAVIFNSLKLAEGKSERIFAVIFCVEYIVPLSHWLLLF